MSFVTTIMVFTSDINSSIRLEQVNAFELNGIFYRLESVEKPCAPPFQWYGGNKKFLGDLFIGSFDKFPKQEFLIYLQTIDWEYPDEVQVFVHEENRSGFSVYSHAGKVCVYESSDLF